MPPRRRFDLKPLAIHVNYLTNLASPDPVIRTKSIAAFRGELERAALLRAEYLVTHPGSYKSSTPPESIQAFAEGLRDAAEGVDLAGVTVLLENTVGAGAQLGGTFAELNSLRELGARLSHVPLGYCLDTCHLQAAGFDITSPRGLETTLKQMDRELGLRWVRLIHANDSKGARGSRLDRHANIGEGTIGEAAFRRILRHPSLRKKPFILETPVDVEGDDRRNLDTLKRLAGVNETRAKRKDAGKVLRIPSNRT